MLSDIAHDREEVFFCDRLEEVDKLGSPCVKKRLHSRKYNSTLAHTSKTKLHDTKHRVNKVIRKDRAWLFDSSLRRSHGRIPGVRYNHMTRCKFKTKLLNNPKFEVTSKLLLKRSYIFTTRLKRSLGRFKSKWLGPGDINKHTPSYTRYEVERSWIDGKHTSDPP